MEWPDNSTLSVRSDPFAVEVRLGGVAVLRRTRVPPWLVEAGVWDIEQPCCCRLVGGQICHGHPRNLWFLREAVRSDVGIGGRELNARILTG